MTWPLYSVCGIKVKLLFTGTTTVSTGGYDENKFEFLARSLFCLRGEGTSSLLFRSVVLSYSLEKQFLNEPATAICQVRLPQSPYSTCFSLHNSVFATLSSLFSWSSVRCGLNYSPWILATRIFFLIFSLIWVSELIFPQP